MRNLETLIIKHSSEDVSEIYANVINEKVAYQLKNPSVPTFKNIELRSSNSEVFDKVVMKLTKEAQNSLETLKIDSSMSKLQLLDFRLALTQGLFKNLIDLTFTADCKELDQKNI